MSANASTKTNHNNKASGFHKNAWFRSSSSSSTSSKNRSGPPPGLSLQAGNSSVKTNGVINSTNQQNTSYQSSSTINYDLILRDRFLQLILNLVGKEVVVHKIDGRVIEGVLETFSPFPSLEKDKRDKYIIRACRMVKDGDGFGRKEKAKNITKADDEASFVSGGTLIISACDVSQVYARSVRIETGVTGVGPGSASIQQNRHHSGIKTDSNAVDGRFGLTDTEISGGKMINDSSDLVMAGNAWTSSTLEDESNSQLEGNSGTKYVGNTHGDQSKSLQKDTSAGSGRRGLFGTALGGGNTNKGASSAYSSTSTGGALQGDIGKWDQFAANRNLTGRDASYDENLYTTTLDRSSVDERKQIEAERLAREIEGQTTSNLHLAEERGQRIEKDFGKEEYDEEDLYSGVLVKKGTGEQYADRNSKINNGNFENDRGKASNISKERVKLQLKPRSATNINNSIASMSNDEHRSTIESKPSLSQKPTTDSSSSVNKSIPESTNMANADSSPTDPTTSYSDKDNAKKSKESNSNNHVPKVGTANKSSNSSKTPVMNYAAAAKKKNQISPPPSISVSTLTKNTSIVPKSDDKSQESPDSDKDKRVISEKDSKTITHDKIEEEGSLKIVKDDVKDSIISEETNKSISVEELSSEDQGASTCEKTLIEEKIVIAEQCESEIEEMKDTSKSDSSGKDFNDEKERDIDDDPKSSVSKVTQTKSKLNINAKSWTPTFSASTPVSEPPQQQHQQHQHTHATTMMSIQHLPQHAHAPHYMAHGGHPGMTQPGMHPGGGGIYQQGTLPVRYPSTVTSTPYGIMGMAPSGTHIAAAPPQIHHVVSAQQSVSPTSVPGTSGTISVTTAPNPSKNEGVLTSSSNEVITKNDDDKAQEVHEGNSQDPASVGSPSDQSQQTSQGSQVAAAEIGTSAPQMQQVQQPVSHIYPYYQVPPIHGTAGQGGAQYHHHPGLVTGPGQVPIMHGRNPYATYGFAPGQFAQPSAASMPGMPYNQMHPSGAGGYPGTPAHFMYSGPGGAGGNSSTGNYPVGEEDGYGGGGRGGRGRGGGRLRKSGRRHSARGGGRGGYNSYHGGGGGYQGGGGHHSGNNGNSHQNHHHHHHQQHEGDSFRSGAAKKAINSAENAIEAESAVSSASKEGLE